MRYTLEDYRKACIASNTAFDAARADWPKGIALQSAGLTRLAEALRHEKSVRAYLEDDKLGAACERVRQEFAPLPKPTKAARDISAMRQEKFVI